MMMSMDIAFETEVQQPVHFIGKLNMKSKVVLITGASSGIGEGTALRFASLGCWLSLTARNILALNEVAEKCRAKGVPKDKVLVIQGDITSADDITAIVKETAEHFGKIDILVNNAGISKAAPLGKIHLDDFDEVYNTNLRSAFNMTQQALPYLKKTKETRHVLFNLNGRSTSGSGGVSDNLLRNLDDKAIEILTAEINEVWSSGQVPSEWHTTKTPKEEVACPKAEDEQGSCCYFQALTDEIASHS
ncbi:putative oxidoreductase SERP2049 [Dermacentor variabilis]|uniref:putative oxidoreductase SERP2049 n=1 Tax=Dermacentor variabilis TaxID=34621 RepID=UPI003F5B8518